MYTLEWYSNDGEIHSVSLPKYIHTKKLRDVYNLIYSFDLSLYSDYDIQYVEVYSGGSLKKTYVI